MVLVAAVNPLLDFPEAGLDGDPEGQGNETGPQQAPSQAGQKRAITQARRPAFRTLRQVTPHLGGHFRGKLSVKIFPQPAQDFRALHSFHASGGGALTA